MQTAFSKYQLSEDITSFFGEKLSESDLESCLTMVEVLDPPVAKQFWQLANAEPGIYMVLAGKVRLLDYADNLITTLTKGTAFGEATLFSQTDWQIYTARASDGLKLCYISGEILQTLMLKYPSIRSRLFAHAEVWDLLLTYCAKTPQRPISVPGILKALFLFERYDLEVGQVPAELYQNSQWWLVYRGELANAEGRKLVAGEMRLIQQQNWQVTQPAIVYVLKNSHWQTAVQHWPELGLSINLEASATNNTARKPRQSRLQAPDMSLNRKVIPFPMQTAQQSKPEKPRPYFPSPKVKIGHWWRNFAQRYPFYAQQSAADCGAACLVMICNYWGKHFSLNRLRQMTNINRNGASLTALATAAESLGFAARPVKASLDKLAEQPLPAIAHWENKHFIVVYKITTQQVIVCDPAIGQRSLTKQEFLAGWTGFALLLQPTARLNDTEEENTSVWKFFQLLKPHYGVLLEIFMASVVMQLFGLVTPVFTQLLLDRVLVQRSLVTLNAVGLGMIIFGLFNITMNGVRAYLLSHTANRISISLLVGFIQHTFRLPLSYFESRYVGDIVSRIQENRKIQQFLIGQTLSVILDMLTLVIYLALMFWYSWQMALFVLLTVPPFFILALASTSILRRISREVFNAGVEENSYIIQSLTGIRTVRSLAIEQTVRWRWEELLNNLVKKAFNGQIIGIRLSMISGAINTFVSAALMWFGAWQVIQGELSIGQLMAFNMLVGHVLSPFQRLSQLWNQLQEILISTERINDVLEAEPEEDLQHQLRTPLGRIRGHIRFENVTFRYHSESETNVLENISFEIQPEQMVALVGRSGSGKTTLSKLILGLYPPTEGKVLIDGCDVTSIALRSLRSQVGVVDQDTFLFGGTIRENISIAHPEASLEEIIEAAKLAGADEFIQKLPMGYESQIGEGGGMLSGGQRQRLAIARALMGNPRLLLFDEATSHLDSETERIIQNNLKTILKGRTSVIIAHRLSTIRNADLILVLDRGLLVESGTHEELIAKQGHYYYLNQQQLSKVG
ncbi:peptidase domain-containing ABC transporter [Anabaena sp. CA = ATCC 33047]|uniref:peptidase domain-containing ABC transporter n=1 Tax=Anabaena sp. (strain CA / ATCC 33047) TaxID=52271 RepID=UPI0008324094|nr:peptidase domain-containing ABC transporter [Anabaena sp. CA = ATCC 33047]